MLFHSLFGRRVNDALSRALAYVVGRFGKRDIEIGINDNGFFLASHRKIQIEKAIKNLKAENLKEILEEAVLRTEVFKRRFRHCATRALMILRNYKGKQKSVGKQQLGSHFLLAAVKKVSSEFPILKETKREILEDVMDIENSIKVLKAINDGKIKIDFANSEIPSPFAWNLIIQSHSDLMKIEDKLNFLKRMHEKVINKIKK